MRFKTVCVCSFADRCKHALTACQPAAPETIVQTVIVEGTPRWSL